MIFLSCYIPEFDLKQIMKTTITKPQNAVTRFQWSILDGLGKVLPTKFNVVNALPIGSWPLQNKRLVFKQRLIESEMYQYHETLTINLPVIKQITRYLSAKRILHSIPDQEVLLYSAYLPFLMAATSRRLQKKTTIIVPDLPEYYDSLKTGWIAKIMRKIVVWLTMKNIEKVDRFVLLTREMHDSLRVGDRPFVVVEGITPPQGSFEQTSSYDFSQKNILLYSGSLNPVFGILDLVDSMQFIDDPEVELWICGAGGAIKEIELKASLDPRIKYLGFLALDEVSYLQRQATLLVNPRSPAGEYTKYSFPSKTMEYMLSGRPILMYKLPGIPDDYDDYLLYVKANETLAEAINRILKLPRGSLNEIGEKAREYVIEHKNSIKQVDRIMQLVTSDVSVK